MAKSLFRQAQERLELRRNEDLACWELALRPVHPDQAATLVARFYDGDRRYSPIGAMVHAVLTEPEMDA